MDKKAFLAVGLSLAIWVAWQKYYLEPIQQQQQAVAEAQRQAQEQAAQAEAAKAPAAAPVVAESPVSSATDGKKNKKGKNAKADAPPAPVVTLKTATLENGRSRVVVSNEGFAVKGWELQSFSKTLEKREDKVTLEDVTGFPAQLKVRFSDASLNPATDGLWSEFRQLGPTSAESKLDTPAFTATRVFTLDADGYGGELSYRFHFAKEAPKFVFLDLHGSPHRATDKEGSIFGQAPDKVKVSYRDLSGHTSIIGAQLKENREAAGGTRWLGLDTRYFVLAMVPPRDAANDLGSQIAHDQMGQNPAVRGSLVFPTQGKTELAVAAKIYFGPKDMAALTKVDPILGDAIDFGWTSFLAIPLLQALKWLYTYVKNYGVAIIVLTFLIKMALFPLMYKSMKSMAKMSLLQPQLNALREKYKDDKERLNVEMMNFMKANGYNPVGGCLPILLQMPIFFALYRVLFNSMELYQAPFAGWIHDLSSPDPFFVTPVLLTGLMYLQQKLSPNTAADPAQQKMLQIMPLMFGAFMLMLPSGLTVYMVVNSAVSIAQQYFLNHKLGIKRAKPAVA